MWVTKEKVDNSVDKKNMWTVFLEKLTNLLI